MDPRSSGELVGREGILRDLSEALARSASGIPTVVVLSGETGVGKTRLVQEFLAGAEALSLAGACIPVAGEPLPYAALAQALRQGGDGLVDREVRGSPELARLLPAASGDAVPTTPDPGSEATSRMRLFQAVLGLLGRVSEHRPVVHVVEDVHWADRSTLDLLTFLVGNLNDERVLLLLTHRDDAPDESSDLASWLVELGRMDARTVRVPRLERDDAARLVTSLAGAVPPERLEETLARSDGNPLFVEQLVMAGDGPGQLPATLHELLRVRVEALPADTRRLLRAAAVIGRVASGPLLARTLGRPVEDVEDALRAGLAARVAEVRADDRIGFHHPAFREVVYAELLPGERTRLHRAAAEALEEEADPAPEVAGEVARHWHLAGDLERALAASITAGRAYEQMYAFGAAGASFGLALELLDRVGDPRVDRLDLAVRAASSASVVGDNQAAVRLLHEQLHRVADPARRAVLLERLGAAEFVAGDVAAAETAYRSATELLPDEEVSVLSARVHAGLGLLAAAWSRLDEGEDEARRGLAISCQVDARREEGTARNALGLVAASRGDLDTGVDHLEASLAIAREVESPFELGQAYVNLSHVLGLAGRLDHVVDLARGGLSELDRFGQDRQFGSLLLCNASDALIKAGRLPQAEELIGQALGRHPRGVMAAPVLLLAAKLTVAQGDLPAAWERCEQARLIIEAEGAPLGWWREVTETSAEVELWAGRPQAALEIAQDGLAAISDTDEAVFGSALVGLGLRALADLAFAHRDARSRQGRAPARQELLDARAAVGALPGWAELPETQALDRQAAAELARLDLAPAAEPWRGAAAAWDALGRPLPAAYARWREAEELLGAGVDVDSIGALRAVHDTAQGLGAARLVQEVEALAAFYRVDLLPPAVPDPGPDPLAGYALTAREKEVLAALAAGRTNREIADALFISVKTASVHVSNILRKLDVPGRQEAARVAHQLGSGRGPA
ncbi:helix-turn-helix transcriptional regulator [Nocardioides sp. GXQ0305]|uniref:helix-turn-helix transcriptional regulator n=1 Tax=Nocardioides sp. GXQ0305 TaxID=3423912 RepID=UPI003D7DB6AF